MKYSLRLTTVFLNLILILSVFISCSPGGLKSTNSQNNLEGELRKGTGLSTLNNTKSESKENPDLELVVSSCKDLSSEQCPTSIRGPKFLFITLTNKGSTDADALSFTFDSNVATVSNIGTTCPTNEPFKLAGGAGCFVVFEAKPLEALSSRAGSVILNQNGVQAASLSLSNKSYLYAGGSTGLAQWDGLSWTSLSPTGGFGTVNALAVDNRMRIYVADYSPLDGGGETSRLHNWDGTSWSLPLFEKVSGRTNAIAFHPAQNALYAGGSFTDINGNKEAKFIAKTDLYPADELAPVVWEPLDGAQLLNSTAAPVAVNALAATSAILAEDIVSFITFTEQSQSEDVYNDATRSPLVRIFKVENTSQYADMSNLYLELQQENGKNSFVFETSDDYYNNKTPLCALSTGSSFRLAKGSSCLVVIRTIVPAENGAAPQIRNTGKISLKNNDEYLIKSFNLKHSRYLYAGGTFSKLLSSSSADRNAHLVARYDGTQWSSLDATQTFGSDSTERAVNALAVDSLGRVYLGGSFTASTADNKVAQNIVRWEGGATGGWKTVGNGAGFDKTVHVLVQRAANSSSGNAEEWIVVGGEFDQFLNDSGSQHLPRLGVYGVTSDSWTSLEGFTTESSSDTVHDILFDISSKFHVAGRFTQNGNTVTALQYNGDNMWAPFLNEAAIKDSAWSAVNSKRLLSLSGFSYTSNVGTNTFFHGVGTLSYEPNSIKTANSIALDTAEYSQCCHAHISVTTADMESNLVYDTESYTVQKASAPAEYYTLSVGSFSKIQIKDVNSNTFITDHLSGLAHSRLGLRSNKGVNCNSDFCYPDVTTPTTAFGGLAGGNRGRVLLRVPAYNGDAIDPSKHGLFYIGGSFTSAGTSAAHGIALLNLDESNPTLRGVGDGIADGEVRAFAFGEALDVTAVDPLTEDLKIVAQPHTETQGYYIDHKTRGPFFQVISVTNLTKETISGLSVKAEIPAAQSDITLEKDPAYLNGRAPCLVDATKTFELAGNDECVLLVRHHNTGAWGKQTFTIDIQRSLNSEARILKSFSLTTSRWLIAGGTFDQVQTPDGTDKTLALYTARFDGAAWNALQPPSDEYEGDNNLVSTLGVSPTGTLTVGGRYKIQYQRGPENKILANFSGWSLANSHQDQWFPLGSSSNTGISEKQPLATLLKGVGWYLGGDFTAQTANGSTQRFAYYEKGNWFAQGAVPNDTIRALTQFSDADPYIYAAGDFNAIGSTALPYVARWHSTQKYWHPLGAGLEGPVYALVVAQQLTGR